MVTLNHENYFDWAITNLVTQQNNWGFKLVIREDCSTDSTWTICKKNAKKSLDLIVLLPSEL